MCGSTSVISPKTQLIRVSLAQRMQLGVQRGSYNSLKISGCLLETKLGAISLDFSVFTVLFHQESVISTAKLILNGGVTLSQ